MLKYGKWRDGHAFVHPIFWLQPYNSVQSFFSQMELGTCAKEMACTEYVIHANDTNGTKCNVFHTNVDNNGGKASQRHTHTHTHMKCKWIVWTASVWMSERTARQPLGEQWIHYFISFFYSSALFVHLTHAEQKTQRKCNKKCAAQKQWPGTSNRKKISGHSHCQTLKIKTSNYVMRELKQIGI